MKRGEIKEVTNDYNRRARSPRDDGLEPVLNPRELFFRMSHIEDYQIQRTMREEELVRCIVHLSYHVSTLLSSLLSLSYLLSSKIPAAEHQTVVWDRQQVLSQRWMNFPVTDINPIS